MENKNKRICSHCGARLNEDSIGFFTEGVNNYYKISLSGDSLEYDLDESEGSGEFGFFCRECGRDLHLSEEEVKEILKEV